METKRKSQSTAPKDTPSPTKEKKAKASTAGDIEVNEGKTAAKSARKLTKGNRHGQPPGSTSSYKETSEMHVMHTDEVKRELKREVGYRPWDSDCDTPAIFFVASEEAIAWIEERRKLGHSHCQMALERFFENQEGWILSITSMIDADAGLLKADSMDYPPIQEAAVIGRSQKVLPKLYIEDQTPTKEIPVQPESGADKSGAEKASSV